MSTTPNNGRVRLRAIDAKGPALAADLLGQASVAGGVGGWSELARPLRATAAEWNGIPALTQTFTVLLDGTPQAGRQAAVSIEPDCRVLLELTRPTKTTGRPPVLTLTGPVYYTDRQWVIDNLTWGTEIRNDAAERIQQDVTIDLREWVATASVKGPASKSRDRKNKYAIGDTSRRELGIGSEPNQ